MNKSSKLSIPCPGASHLGTDKKNKIVEWCLINVMLRDHPCDKITPIERAKILLQLVLLWWKNDDASILLRSVPTNLYIAYVIVTWFVKCLRGWFQKISEEYYLFRSVHANSKNDISFAFNTFHSHNSKIAKNVMNAKSTKNMHHTIGVLNYS